MKPEIKKEIFSDKKTEWATVGLRVKRAEKEEIRSAAHEVGCTISGYLLRLHRYVATG